jgi:hypothetical protein
MKCGEPTLWRKESRGIASRHPDRGSIPNDVCGHLMAQNDCEAWAIDATHRDRFIDQYAVAQEVRPGRPATRGVDSIGHDHLVTPAAASTAS